MNRRWGRAALAVLAVVVVIVVLRALGSGGEEGDGSTDVAVHVGTIDRATLHRTVTAYGVVEPAPGRAGQAAAGALITPFVGGVLARIDGVEGGHVTGGTVLFRLDSRMAEVTVQKATQARDFARQALERQRELLEFEGTSQRAFQEAQQRFDAAASDLAAAETGLAYLQIATPLTGTVVRIDARVGQFVDASTVLAEVVDLDRLVVSADVPSREAVGLAVGQTVRIGPASDGLVGELTIVSRDVDPNTGTYRVQASIPAGAGLASGEFTDIRIVVEEHADVLVVPEVSLVSRAGEGSWIMVVEGDRATRTPVTVGLRDRGLVEVSGAGIEEGMTIVTDDAYSLPEETKIHLVGG